MSSVPVAACKDCLCYYADVDAPVQVDLSKPRALQGTCHRFPPLAVSASRRGIQGMELVPAVFFPSVEGDWWCAEFRLRSDKNATNSEGKGDKTEH